MKPIKRLIEELNEVEQGLELPQKVRYNEDSNNEEEIILPKQEYAIVMSILETWLRNIKNYKNKTYIRKEHCF